MATHRHRFRWLQANIFVACISKKESGSRIQLKGKAGRGSLLVPEFRIIGCTWEGTRVACSVSVLGISDVELLLGIHAFVQNANDRNAVLLHHRIPNVDPEIG